MDRSIDINVATSQKTMLNEKIKCKKDILQCNTIYMPLDTHTLSSTI